MAVENLEGHMDKVHSQLASNLKALQEHHLKNGRAAFHLDRKLKNDPAFLQEFIKDPVTVAKREGVTMPEGFHFHFVDEHNTYFPPEGNAISQLQKGKTVPVWGRLEIRYAVGPGCLVGCGGCTC